MVRYFDRQAIRFNPKARTLTLTLTLTFRSQYSDPSIYPESTQCDIGSCVWGLGGKEAFEYNLSLFLLQTAVDIYCKQLGDIICLPLLLQAAQRHDSSVCLVYCKQLGDMIHLSASSTAGTSSSATSSVCLVYCKQLGDMIRLSASSTANSSAA
jgi:hypothetical protein